MRIALVAPGFPPDPGGVETVVGNLAYEYVERGHPTTVLCHVRHGSDGQETAPSQPLLDVERFKDWARSRRFPMSPPLWRRLRTAGVDVDIIHTHSFHASPAFAASVLSPGPQVFSPYFHKVGHTSTARMLHRAYDPLAQRIFSRSAAVVCVSEAEADLLLSAYPLASGRIHVIPTGIDTARLLAATPFPTDRRVVLAAGRLEAYKQVDLLVRAAPLLSDDTLVVVAGGGPELANLERLAADLGVGGKVRFVGHVALEDLRRWQRTAAVSVSLSKHESFGLVLLEGAVAGAALVATDLSAHRELASRMDLAIAFVSPAATPGEVASAVAAALAGEGTRLSDAGVASASWHEAATRTLGLYQSVLNG